MAALFVDSLHPARGGASLLRLPYPVANCRGELIPPDTKDRFLGCDVYSLFLHPAGRRLNPYPPASGCGAASPSHRVRLASPSPFEVLHSHRIRLGENPRPRMQRFSPIQSCRERISIPVCGVRPLLIVSVSHPYPPIWRLHPHDFRTVRRCPFSVFFF